MLSQTAAIVEGDLSDVQFTYDDCAGPRTNYVLTNARTLAGSTVPSQVKISILGGPMPDGSWIKVSELPRLALDSHYVVFLRKSDWTFSPVVANLIFRRETIGGREVLIHPDGQLVTGWNDSGPTLSAAVVSARVGSSIRGYRTVPAPANGPYPPPVVSTNPAVQTRVANVGSPLPGRSQQPVIPEGSVLGRGPTAAEIRAAGFFARPAILDTASAENALSQDELVSAVKSAARRSNIDV